MDGLSDRGLADAAGVEWHLELQQPVLRAAQAAAPRPGDRALVLGPGTIGLLAAMFLRTAGAEVHLMGNTGSSLAFARELGFEHVWAEDSLPDLPFDAVVDASNAAHLPDRALELVEPSGRVVYIGLAGAVVWLLRRFSRVPLDGDDAG